MIKKLYNLIYIFICITGFVLVSSFAVIKPDLSDTTGILKISFINTANGKPILLRDSLYNNFFGEQYSISKLKYYITDIAIDKHKISGDYYLVNAATEENNIELSLEVGKYTSLQFLLGVDSIHNCSGAQTGALDPMNDMFWTWNSGYVMFKLEGTSLASTADLNRIEHHIGGYKGTNNVATIIHPDLSNKTLEIKAGSITELVIEMNLDHYWHGNTDIKISELPVSMIPGELSKKIAANFNTIFSVKSIQPNP